MTTTATASAIRYRKTKTGEWVAYGPATMALGVVHIRKADGSVAIRTVTRLGRPFTAAGEEMVYGYLAPEAAPARRRAYGSQRTATGHARGCPVTMGINACDCDD